MKTRIIIITLLCAFALPALAQKKVTELPATTTIDPSDVILVVHSGVTSKITYSNLLIAVLAGQPAAYSPAYVTLTDGATVTITCSTTKVAQNAVVTLGGNRTLAISGAANGMFGQLIVKQDGTGGRTLTLPAGSKVGQNGAGVINLTAAGGSTDILNWIYDGTNYYWSYGNTFN